MKIEDYERIFPTTIAEDLRFHTPNSACVWRVQTLLSKEPDTIAWLRSMAPNEVFFDVGANMGQYSLLAAKYGLTVHAFEPDSQNFALLCRNIALNNETGHRITAWPLALSDSTKLSTLHVTGLQYGGSCHAFDNPLDFRGQPKTFSFQHGAVGYRLDDFCFSHLSGTIPAHIKIDVDGFEPAVLAGGPVVLRSPNLRSVLVELNSNLAEHRAVFDTMRAHGFIWDEAQVASSRRTEGPFAGVGNCIFHRAENPA